MNYFNYYIRNFLYNFYTIILNLFYYLRFYYYKTFTHKFCCDDVNDVYKRGWLLTFQDEFDGDSVDFDRNWNKWFSHNTMWGPETSGARMALDCIEVKDGFLHLSTKINEPGDEYPCRTGLLDSCKVNYWYNGQLKEKYFGQKFGYFETRCKPPKQGKLFWPAFWLWPDAAGWPPEIDIFEFMSPTEIGKDYTKKITMTNHYGSDGKKEKNKFLGSQLGRTLNGVDWSEDFHTYAVKWEWNYIEWYIDNVVVYRTSYNIPSCKMRIVINNGFLTGRTPKEEDFPSDFVVDYVRAYKKIT